MLRLAMTAALLIAILAPATAQAGPPQAVEAPARGTLPSDRLHFGLSNGPGTELDWLVAAKVPWRYRYQYLAGGVNNGGAPGDPCGVNNGWQTWNSPAGQFVTNDISDSVANSTIPVFTYYEIVQSNPSAGDESAELTKISTVCTMQHYWADFTVLMQKIGSYGGLAVVHVEPDFWGFMEQQSSDPSTLPAAVASSGNPDLAGLPNTVQGMGWAFLKLRDKYAPNALLGIHASSWASGVDIASDQRSTVDPAAEADRLVSFINKTGITGNPVGITPWDLVFNDVADHDAGWYGAASNPHWWDRNNVLFPNFTRWLAFMNRIHTDTGLPLVEWQVPIGNQYFDTENNSNGHYQDNRAEYFISHPTQLTASGIVALLFGSGNAGQTTYTDMQADGVTNPAAVVSWQCNQCNNHVSTASDDDGGFLRMAVGAYYHTYPGTACNLFPGDSIFNTDISTLPVSSQSSTWMGNMTQSSNLHPDLGTVAQQYGMPVNLAPPPSSGLTPTFTYNSDSDHPAEGYPIDQSTLIEGGPGAPSGSDRHALVINKSICKLYELFNLQNFTNGQQPSAGSGATWDLTSNAMRPDGFTSADAAGLPITPLLLRPDEIQAGVIAHAIRFTAHCTSTYIWPASHQAGSCNSAFPPMGARFRLKSSFNISTFSPSTQVVLRAFQHYGMILADNGSDWFFGGTTDDWWGTTTGSQMVSELKTIPASQFDAVDETSLQVSPTSYQAVAGVHPCSSVNDSPAPASPQLAGASVTFTATSTGCPHPLYQFWLRPPGASWQIAKAYSPTTTLSWSTAGLAPGDYLYTVWARDASSPGVQCGSLGCNDAFFVAQTYTLTVQRCTSVTDAPAPASPQLVGTNITFTAGSTGCPNPRYQFWLRPPGGSWQVVQPYSTGNTFIWRTAGSAAGDYLYTAWARDVTSPGVQCGSLGCNDAFFVAQTFTLTLQHCASVADTPSPGSPQLSATSITFTATSTGCPNPLYQFWIRPPGGSWQIARAYSSSTTFSWDTTGLAPSDYLYTAWARDASSSGTQCSSLGCNDAFFVAQTFALTSQPCTSVNDSPTPGSPQPSGTGVTFTATSTGCPHPLYQFWIRPPGGSWQIVKPYSSSTSFTWDTTGLAPGSYLYTAWVRDASSSGTQCSSLGCNDAYFVAQSYGLS